MAKAKTTAKIWRPARKEIREELEADVIDALETVKDSSALLCTSSRKRIKKVSDRRLEVALSKLEQITEEIDYVQGSL